MPQLPEFILALLACLCLSTAHASDDLIEWLMKVGDYQEVYRLLSADARNGDGEKQELVADLLLGPYGQQVKHTQYEGIHFLYDAAAGGRASAMLKLSNALKTGSFGARPLPNAAACWAKMPRDLKQRFECMRITDFVDFHPRFGCRDIPYITDPADQAKLCLAFKTPTLLVPGPPPGPDAILRQREYAKSGIVLVITGDVYEEKFERFRETFNATTIAGIEKERGRGYLQKLSNQIEAKIKQARRDAD